MGLWTIGRWTLPFDLKSMVYSPIVHGLLIKTANLVKTVNLVNLARCFLAVANLPAILHEPLQVDLHANLPARLQRPSANSCRTKSISSRACLFSSNSCYLVLKPDSNRRRRLTIDCGSIVVLFIVNPGAPRSTVFPSPLSRFLRRCQKVFLDAWKFEGLNE
jgi:hypothetical protein